MGLARTRSVTLEGMRGRMIEIEVDIASGLPKIILVGLPDASLAESRDRCRAAVTNSGCTWPDHKVTIALSPASLPKAGSHFDLAIALSVLAAAGVVPPEPLAGTLILGELALDGRLRAVPGVLPATLAGVESGCTRVMVPEVNAAEAEAVDDVKVVGVRSLRHAIALLTGAEVPDDPPVPPLETTANIAPHGRDRLGVLDLADVAGQHESRVSVVVAAAGGHHLYLNGPPGVGKTMLAQRMPALLPDLGRQASLETSAVHSVAGLLTGEDPLMSRPPFLDPHHTASAVSIVGGGSRRIRPGAMSLAHNGILFMDEAPEFARDVLNALRQPLENGYVTISRAAQVAEFPASFQLVLAANPCPCGLNYGQADLCECTSLTKRNYRDRVSGPIRDRIDIHRVVNQPSRSDLHAALEHADPSSLVAERIAAARDRQLARYRGTPWRINADVPGVRLRRDWPLTAAAEAKIDGYLRSNKLSARAADRVFSMAWTVSDLDGVATPDVDEVVTALALHRAAPLNGHITHLVGSA